MGYIIKNTSGLLNTRITDVGRKRISTGNFNINYFQIGDSEVFYNISENFSLSNNNILIPSFNAQNDTGVPESNKENIKYPYYLDSVSGNTYGIPYLDSRSETVYNSAGVKGFFLTGGTTGWTAQTSSAYTITSNYRVDMSTLSGQTGITLTLDVCSPTTGTPSVGDFLVLYLNDESCGSYNSNVPVLTYKIQSLTPSTGNSGQTPWVVGLDRESPIYTGISSPGQYARCLIYPSGMTQLYDTVTPLPNWSTDTLNFESVCDLSVNEDTLVWNMNIPWSESPAGLFSTTHENYLKYGSVSYLGTKELLGYNSSSGGTDTSEVYHYNSYKEKIKVLPENQKAIAIIHYTNQSIDNVYGEKFATVPYDEADPSDDTGSARHFKLHIPTLMWHKSDGSKVGETFYIDPPAYDLCIPYYIRSSKNPDMNDPGIRYYHLWDTNPDSNNNLNRIGKVFPDQQLVIIDDEEVIAALSYKSNRNWTLPEPKLSLIAPNVCFDSATDGMLSGSTQRLWVTYRLDSTGFTNSLHCNYYSYVDGPQSGNTISQNVAFRFGSEFPFLNQSGLSGFSASEIKILCQKTSSTEKPSPDGWVEIDYTSEISGSTINGNITQSGLTKTTFIIDNDKYDSGVAYNLSNYINIPENGETDLLNFGDEYFFYGNLETDIAATIYEMRYLVTLNNNQFTLSSNPTWDTNKTPYVTEIGLYNSDKELMVLSKLQSPQKRVGIQQFLVKLDF